MFTLRSDDPTNRQEAQALAGDQLRAIGLRSTPQRRAILAAFRGGHTEHLSADEVYARATVTLPDLGRGTVYATLAEFAEVGLLASIGTPEPVRYETNIDRHAHFRCRLCLRMFDVAIEREDPAAFERQGHRVESLELRAEGVCADCLTYEGALEAAIGEIRESGTSAGLADLDLAVGELDTPVGTLLIAATPSGLARVAFPDHGDAAFLRSRLEAASPGPARAHLELALEQLRRYFSGQAHAFDVPIDWDAVGVAAQDLRAVTEIPYGDTRSYHLIDTDDGISGRAHAYGANPIPIVTPCHRVSRGAVLPNDFVGGAERRVWLLEHERASRGN